MYNYQEQRKNVFTEQGQEVFLKIRDCAKALLAQSGAFMMSHVLRVATGDSWLLLACVDRLVELGEIREITTANVAGQHRVFVSSKS